ncbi:MAG: amino-acid N-acetyltransferase [Gammaproteobacteria bacterium]|jgi:amino-acid N-acetyltransferase
MINMQDFVPWFRSTAPYIKAHRGKTFVIQISDEIIFSERFTGLVNDIALLNHLGTRLVILHGSRSSIDRHLSSCNLTSKFHKNIRISDQDSLPIIIQAINEVRNFLESQLSVGLPNTPMSGSEISLVSGNFVTGMPLGVIDGVDMQHSGKVRAVKDAIINQMLDLGHVVLLSNIGYSLTGEVFNLPAEELAVEAAQALKADKLIFIHHDHEKHFEADTLSTIDCRQLIQQNKVDDQMKYLLGHAIQAVENKISRVHLINQRIDGGLLLELFTRDGDGIMITDRFYEGLRQARIEDVAGISQIIEPLENGGVLVARSREQLELQIGYFYVIEKDGLIIACIACIPDQTSKSAEIACLAVHHGYQNAGFGRQLLSTAEQAARQQNIRQLFTLTTTTSHWFIEQGFSETHVDTLPESKRSNYNQARRSKVFVKEI